MNRGMPSSSSNSAMATSPEASLVITTASRIRITFAAHEEGKLDYDVRVHVTVRERDNEIFHLEHDEHSLRRAHLLSRYHSTRNRTYWPRAVGYSSIGARC